MSRSKIIRCRQPLAGYKMNRQGSYTVEAALVMTFILVVMFTLIFSFFVIYQQALLTHTACSAALKVARARPVSNTEGLQVYINKQLEQSIGRPDQTMLDIVNVNNPLNRTVNIGVLQEITLPWSGLKEFLNEKNTMTIEGKAVSAIVEPADYIRNIDLFLELGTQYGWTKIRQ